MYMSLTQDQINLCWAQIKAFAPASVSWNHYDLAAKTNVPDVELWKKFQQRRDVCDWLEEERALLQQSEFAKLSTNVANSRSTGQAQLLTAMERINALNKTDINNGPTFIYTYVPLNTEQVQATNVIELKEDIFYVKPAEFQFDKEFNPQTLPEGGH